MSANCPLIVPKRDPPADGKFPGGGAAAPPDPLGLRLRAVMPMADALHICIYAGHRYALHICRAWICPAYMQGIDMPGIYAGH